MFNDVRYRLNKLLTCNETKKDTTVLVSSLAQFVLTVIRLVVSRIEAFFYNASTPLEVIPVG